MNGTELRARCGKSSVCDGGGGVQRIASVHVVFSLVAFLPPLLGDLPVRGRLPLRGTIARVLLRIIGGLSDARSTIAIAQPMREKDGGTHKGSIDRTRE